MYKRTQQNIELWLGGRIGYNEDRNSFFRRIHARAKRYRAKDEYGRLYKEYLEDLRRKKVAEEKTMAATGGRMGYAMGPMKK